MTTTDTNSVQKGRPEQSSEAESRVRARLNAWARAQPWQSARFGTQIKIDSLITESAYVIRCVSEYERRSVDTESRPYSGGVIDNRGKPPDPWSLSVAVPKNFETTRTRFVLPHTDSVATCGGCGGHGNVTCANCQGTTQVLCSRCRGVGTQICFGCGGGGRRQETRYGTVQVNHPNGGFTSQSVTETVYVICSGCGGGGRVRCGACGRTGWVRCTNCHNGRVQCGSCAGHGRLLWQQIVTIVFAPKERKKVLNPLSLLDREVEAAEGVTVLDVCAPEIPTPPKETPAHLLEPIQLFLRDGSGSRPKNERLHFERLSTARVEVTEVEYSSGKSGPRRLWISGEQERVFAPNAPKDAGKVFFAYASAVVALCLVMTLLHAAWLSTRPPLPAENRALWIRGVATNLAASPPASFKVWVQEVAYTLRVKQMPKGPQYFHNDVDWLTTVAADNDMNAVSTWKISLDAPETETAKTKIRPFYHDFFTYIQAHSYSLATSQSSPYMVVVWAKMRNSKALCYVYGINRFLFHKSTAYQPWKDNLWEGYLQSPHQNRTLIQKGAKHHQ